MFPRDSRSRSGAAGTAALRAVLAAVLMTAVDSPATQAPGARPNILFCFADDWGRYAGVYAEANRPSPNDVVRTPHIDGLARRGVRFQNAFVNAPSCTPCRSALLSGRYFFNTGRAAILQGAVWDGSVEAFPPALNKSGYHIGKSFKVWSPGTPADAPFGGQKFAFQAAGALHNNYSEQVTRLVDGGTPLGQARSRMLSEVSGNFDAFLAAGQPNQPWFYWFGPTTVHRTWVKGSGKKLWGIDPDSLKGKLPKFLPDVPEVREDFADYLGEAQAFDAYVGALLARLKASGQAEQTLVIVSGDHGAPGFPHGKCNLYDFGTGVALVAAGPGIKAGRVVDDFVNLMDLAPTFLELGRARMPGTLDGRSLVPVLHAEKSGQVDPTRDYVVTGRERHVGSAREGNLPYPQRALRTRDFLYIRNFAPDRWPMGAPLAVTDDRAPAAATLENDTRSCFADMDAGPTKAWLVAHRNSPQWKEHYDFAFAKRPAEELYDIRKDPDQLRNVAADPAYLEARKAASARLLELLTRAGDPRVTGDGSTFDKPPFSDPEPAAAKAKGKAKPSR